MTHRTITIIPKVFALLATTYSNNSPVIFLCIDCLRVTKTNREYKDLQECDVLHNRRECKKCHRMTIELAASIANIPMRRILNLAEAHYPIKIPDTDESVTFQISKEYLSILKGQKVTKHG